MQYINKGQREDNQNKLVYNNGKLLDIIDEIGDEIFSLLNRSNTLFKFRDELNSMIVSTPEGNRVYDIIRRLVNRMTDFVRNLDDISCDIIRRMNIEQGLTYKEMSLELNCSVYKIRDLVYKCDAYKDKKPPEKYNIPKEKLSGLLESGMSKKAIAAIFGCSVWCINKRIRKYGLNEGGG